MAENAIGTEPKSLDGVIGQTEWIAAGGIDLTGRFGVFVKYLYARTWADGTLTDRHRLAYKEHIRVFNSFLEMDDAAIPVKIGSDDFLTAFHALLASIARDGFDQRYAVRLGADSMPIDGEHRIAACLALGQPLCVTHVPRPFRSPWGYEFFRDRGMDPAYMDWAMDAALDCFNRLRAAVIFGAALEHKDRIIAALNEAGVIHYEKLAALSPAGQQNLIRLVYKGEEWLGAAADGYPGAYVKSGPTFPSDARSAVSVVFLQPSVSIPELVDVKERIRAALGMGNHSLHITDTWGEARRIGDAVLNANGLHLLNHKRFRRFAAFDRDLSALRARLDEGAVGREHVAVVGSGVLSVYGLRDARDLDVIIAPAHLEAAAKNGLEPNNNHWESHGFDIRRLLYDPRNYFRFDGIKFLSLEPLIKLKTKRGEKKDSVDLSLIRLMIGRRNPLPAAVARFFLIVRLYTNPRWLRSYFDHWLNRLGLRSRRVRSGST